VLGTQRVSGFAQAPSVGSVWLSIWGLGMDSGEESKALQIKQIEMWHKLMLLKLVLKKLVDIKSIL